MKKLIITLLAVALIIVAVPALANGENGDEATTTPEVIEVIPEPASSTSFMSFIPKFAFFRYADGVIDFLTSKFMSARVVCSKKSNPFAIDTFGHPYNPTSSDPCRVSDNPMLGSNYGYDILLEDNSGYWTYHRFELPDFMEGTYYCRTIASIPELFTEIVSPEFIVNR